MLVSQINEEPQDVSVYVDFVAGDLVVDAPALSPETTCENAFVALMERPDRPCLAIVDEYDQVTGLIDRATLLSKFGQPFGRSVYERRPVFKLMDKSPLVVDVATPIDVITRKIATEHPNALTTGFVITDRGVYRGVGLPIDLLSRDAEQAQRRAVALEKANEAARAASEAKSAFLATMSHEIRTPLNGVIGNLELLGFTSLTDDQKELIRNAEVSAQTLLGIIGDILDFSKIEAGKIEIEALEMNPANVLHEVESLLVSRAVQRSISLRHFVGPDVPARVISDDFRLRQIMMNFVSNAVKFTERGGIFLTLHSEGPTGDGRTWLRFECIDTGQGFAPDRGEALFEAFSQEDSTTTRKFGGTGLGLAITRRIARLMGGDVGAWGCPGHGATFWCRVPVEVVEACPTENESLTGISVLFVSRKAKQGNSSKASDGSRIDFASSIAGAMQRFEQALRAATPYDAVVSDMFLPDGDAIVLKQRLGAHHASMIAIASAEEPEQWHRAYGAGYHVVLRKPLDKADLPHALRVVSGRIREQEVEQTTVVDIDSQKAKLRRGGKRHPVLVIDDTAMNRTVAKRQLEKLGLEADFAEDGLQGLEKATTTEYSLLLVDISMPVMDGLEFTRRFREWEQEKYRHRLPLIAMTGNAMESDRQKALEAGMDDFLTKPVKIEAMSVVLVTWLENRPGIPWEKLTGTVENAPQQSREGGEGTVLSDSRPAPAGASSDSTDQRKDSTEKPAEPGATAAGGEPPVDLAALGDLLGEDDPESLKEILHFFLETFQPLFATLELHAAAEDAGQIKSVAHAAKSAARNAAAQRLGNQLAELEAKAMAEDMASLQKRVEDAKLELGRTEQFILGL